IFKVWTDPDHVAHWWGPRGFTLTTEVMDVRPGGVWRYVMHGPDGTDYDNEVIYSEILEPERLVYVHGSGQENDPEQFQVTVTFAEEGSRTRLTMRMVFASPEQRDMIVEKYGAIEGANQTLDRLADHLAGI
ncbi:MAG: SRPBCC family protein, partial [Candidatus Promineifilaceae bacterium]